MITLDWPSGIPEPNFQAGGVAAELDLRSAIISTILCSGSACHTGTCKGLYGGKVAHGDLNACAVVKGPREDRNKIPRWTTAKAKFFSGKGSGWGCSNLSVGTA